jgi:DNA-binding NarL/FixJ family response regulator
MLLLTMQINSSTPLSEAAIIAMVPFLIEENTPQFAHDFIAPSDDPDGQTLPDAPKVLLVDDSETTLARAKSVLSVRCVVVGMATDGQAALEAAATLKPDVVVLDISMPGMNGFELAKRLRAAGSTAQLVFLTVHEEKELILAAKNAGAIGYVVKARLASDLELAVREARAGRPFQSPQS